MGGAAMLRQLIGEIRELWEQLNAASDSSSASSNPLIVYPRHRNNQEQRWCFLDMDNCTMEDGYFDCIMREKSESVKVVEANRSPLTKKACRAKTHERSLSDSSSSEVMEQCIWKEFPEDLFEAVIARLPVATFFRFRVVSRNWNSLLTSSSFSQHCAEVLRARYPWFYTITHEDINSGALYDSSLKKWHHPSIPFLPHKTVMLPVASAGGLVCFLDIDHRRFFVCNPLTNSFKELPPRLVHIWSHVSVGMVLNGHTASSGYKIVWLGCNGDHEVYDSVQNVWNKPGVLPTSVKLPLSLNLRSHTVSIGSTIYFMLVDPDGVLSYDVASGVWKQLIIPLPPQLTDQTLAASRGQVLLVGLLSKNAATCVAVWELQRMTLLWKEVDRMPNVWCLEFYGKHIRMTCLGNQGLLMLSLRSRRMNRLVTYDVEKKEWQKVPDCVLPRGGKQQQWIACGTAFFPCPTAVA